MHQIVGVWDYHSCGKHHAAHTCIASVFLVSSECPTFACTNTCLGHMVLGKYIDMLSRI